MYARRAVLREWLREKGYDPDRVAARLATKTRRWPSAIAAIDVTRLMPRLRLWIESHVGRNRTGRTDRARNCASTRTASSLRTGQPVPIFGKQMLYDGKTGEAV